MQQFYPHNLKPDEKQIFFLGLKEMRPELLDLMQNDEFCKGLRERFGGQYVFEIEEAREIYRKGLDLSKQKKENP